MLDNGSRRFRRSSSAALLLAVFAASPRAFADYPIASHRYLADPGSLVYDGRVYLYNSNDDDNPVAGGYEMKSIVCVSSSDLKNWTDHGEVFRVPTNAAWAGNSWAPAAVARNGKIYLYFGNNANGVGVASSTTPTGTFTDAKGSALVNASTPGASGTNSWLFDPSVFVDDDGQAYLTFGGNGDNNARIIKLNSDMVSVSGSAIALSVPNFFEASWLYKRDSLYYFTYSTNSASGLNIDYMTSSSPTSGFTHRGTVAGQPPSNNNNNHHSDFVFNGTWYHAYHNRSVATQAGISTTYRRNLGLERLNFNADGTIQQVTYTTDGVTQLANLNPYIRVEAETTNAQSGIETEPCSEGGMDVTNINNGDWIKVRGVDFGTGAKSFSARVASASSGGNIELRLDSPTGTLIGTCVVASTGGAQTWADSTCPVTGATGVKDLYLKFTGGSSLLFSVNYWQFTSVDGSAGGAGGAGGADGTGGAAGSAGAAAGGIGGGNMAGGTGNISGGGMSGADNISGGGAGGSRVVGKAGSPAVGVGGAGGLSASVGGSAPESASGSAPRSVGGAGTVGNASDNGGCGCVVGARSKLPHAPVALFIAAMLALRSRRRRAPR
jgi:arabinoxylan arabinofuranohydrolase